MTNPIEALADAARSAKVLAESGLLRPYRPDQILGIGRAVRRYGLSASAVYAIDAARLGNKVAVADEHGELTFRQMEVRTSTLAAGLADMGLGEADLVGVLCRNGRGFIDATVALAKLGADALFLNTGFAGPQLAEVCLREGASALILDEEFLPLASALPVGIPRLLARREDPVGAGPRGGLPVLEGRLPVLEDLAAGDPPPGRSRRDGQRGEAHGRQEHGRQEHGRQEHGRHEHERQAHRREGMQIILTSGTTGVPKGAHREPPTGVDPLVALLARIPVRTRDVTYVAAPMFHAWGLGHLAIGWVMGSTLILRSRFDAEAALRIIEEEQVTVLAAVPVMLQRIMELPEATRARYDTSSLRVVAVSGSALAGTLAQRFMDAFGDVLYNLYGSTEVAWASIATPEDLRLAPGTVGRPTRGTTVKLLDDEGYEVPAGQPGRIFVGNSLLFAGYTGGGGKQVVGGLMSSGDVGHFDDDGRLFVDGRDDDMIVSGGENVFPREVEDLLLEHPAVTDVCVIGVADDEWGQRLRAYVVVGEGASISGDELKDHVRGHLARFKVPREVILVSDIPRNATGKVDKRALPS